MGIWFGIAWVAIIVICLIAAGPPGWAVLFVLMFLLGANGKR